MVIKGYQELTLYLAVNISDLYMAELAKHKLPTPHIVTLGITCLLLAVKMNEPMCPSFSNMIHLLA